MIYQKFSFHIIIYKQNPEITNEFLFLFCPSKRDYKKAEKRNFENKIKSEKLEYYIQYKDDMLLLAKEDNIS